MKDFISKKAINIVTFFYEKIFHEKMSYDVKRFLKNIYYVGFGVMIATVLTFIFNVLAGRLLGAFEYGEFTIVQSVGMFLCIPMMMGFSTAMIKYTAKEEDLKKRQVIVSTTYIFVLIFTIISICVYLLFSSEILRIFSVTRELIYLSIVFAALFVFYSLTTSTLRGLHEMKQYGILLPISSAISLLVLIFFIFINFLSFKSMLLSMYIAYGIIGGIVLAFTRKYIKFEFNKYQSYKLLNYGMYATLGGASAVFYANIDKILINKYMTAADVGIYRAYGFSFVMLFTVFSTIITTVLFPVASKYERKDIIFKRVNKAMPFIAVLGYISTICLGYVILMFYGNEYTFSLKLVLLFGIVGVVMFFDSIYGWLMNSVGKQGIRITSFAAIIMAISDITLNIYLIPLLGIEGAVLAAIISYILSISIVLSKRKYFYNSDRLD